MAAGNEGTSAWHYITTPADADSAFAIAAVDKNGNVAPFSSYGLATDTRVKPNVAAVGAANFVNTNGTVSSGTEHRLLVLRLLAWQLVCGRHFLQKLLGK